jgi:DMSO/TMAO reductase YedYZ molybdopterin-dependent catalytic subunit
MTVNQNVLSTSPENRETPLADVQGWVTPSRWFFVRSHYETPEVDRDTWKISIVGRVNRELELNCEQLSVLPQRSVYSTMECAGNGRSFLSPKVGGVQWNAGAVGHAEWSGVPLKCVLEEAGIKPDAVEIVFEGADSGMEEGYDRPTPYARSLPLEKALHPDTLLATRMNGEVLDLSHGFPVRLLIPGWYGVASVKWLRRIEVVNEPFQGYFQTVKYTVQRATGRGVQREVVGPMPIKSEIIRPADDAVLGVGANRMFGTAWAGEDAVAAVEVSVDGGATWQHAELNGPREPFSWTLWEYLWEVPTPGEYQLLSRAISIAGQIQPTRHDPLLEGYLINFSRPTTVNVDANHSSQDLLGDWTSLRREMTEVARERAALPLDAEMEFISGAGI